MTRSRKERPWADIPSSRVRFVFEAAFLILVAFGAALMELGALTIVLLIAAALLLVALIERASSRETVRSLETAKEELRVPEADPPGGHVHRVDPAKEPEPAPQAAGEVLEEPAATASRAPPVGPVVTNRPLAPPGLERPPAPPPAREWNLWDLERRARELAGNSPRAEEWSALFTQLRVFANPDGVLPREFDGLVRESFGELIEAA